MTAFAAAHSVHRDTRAAMREILGAVPGPARFALLFADLRHDLGLIARLARDHLGPAVTGCSTSGEISSAGLQEGGIVLLAGLAGDLHAASASVPHVKREPAQAARALAARLKAAALPAAANRLLVVHAPGFTTRESGWEHRAFPVLERELGPDVVLVGGSAGDGLKFLGSRVHEGGRAMDDALVGLLVATDRPVAVALRHGYLPTGRSAKVTRSRDIRVLELDGVRATQRYAELCGVSERELTKGAGVVKLGGFLPTSITALSQSFGMTPQRMVTTLPFYRHTVRHPLGIESAGGQFQTMFARLAPGDGSVEFFGPIPEGTTVQLMDRDEEAFERAPEAALRACHERLGGPPAATLVVECSGRKMVLGARLDRSFEHWRPLCEGPLVGFYSHGEQGPLGGPPVTCNNYSVATVCFGGASRGEPASA
jgi:hypothetical protein